MSEPKNRELTRVVTAGIVLSFAAMDCCLPAVMQFNFADAPVWVIFAAIGVGIAQLVLIAAWAVFAPVNLMVRLPSTLLLCLAMWYALMLGQSQLDDSRFDFQGAIAGGLAVLATVFALQVPLWIVKRVFRLRLLSPGDSADLLPHGPFQFQLKHLVIGTFVVALALAPIRFIPPVERFLHAEQLGRSLIIAGFLFVAGLIAGLPGLWAGLGWRVPAWLLGVLWFPCCVVITAVEIGVLSLLVPNGPPPEVFGEFFVVNLAQGLVILLVMRIYRALGFRLTRGVARTAPPATAEPEGKA